MGRVEAKFASRIQGELWLAHDYGKVYAVGKTRGGVGCLRVAASYDGSEILRTLSKSIREPFFLLYVLVVYRGGGAMGRYQSGGLLHEELDALFARYSEFWDGDGRHSIWLRSERDDATLVYDRHNLIYAYGPLERFELVLESLGYSKVPNVSLSFQHHHCYYAEFDALERELTTKFADKRTELWPGDENPG